MLKFWETWVMGWHSSESYGQWTSADDSEGKVCRLYVKGSKILELGCGGRKTVPEAIGVDLIDNGRVVPSLGVKSVADIQADVTEGLPVDDMTQDTLLARHILEHSCDILDTLCRWNLKLKVGGRLIVACPNHSLGNTIVMNPDHKHAITPSSLGLLMSVAGYEEIGVHHDVNGISFVGAYDKARTPFELLRERPKDKVKILCAC